MVETDAPPFFLPPSRTRGKTTLPIPAHTADTGAPSPPPLHALEAFHQQVNANTGGRFSVSR